MKSTTSVQMKKRLFFHHYNIATFPLCTCVERFVIWTRSSGLRTWIRTLVPVILSQSTNANRKLYGGSSPNNLKSEMLTTISQLFLLHVSIKKQKSFPSLVTDTREGCYFLPCSSTPSFSPRKSYRAAFWLSASLTGAGSWKKMLDTATNTTSSEWRICRRVLFGLRFAESQEAEAIRKSRRAELNRRELTRDRARCVKRDRKPQKQSEGNFQLRKSATWAMRATY